jgi:hypothetical protein
VDRRQAGLLFLVSECDVFVQGFRWGSFTRRGFGADDLRRINPRLIYVELNAYGFQGPWAERRGWEQMYRIGQRRSFACAEPVGEDGRCFENPTPADTFTVAGAGWRVSGIAPPSASTADPVAKNARATDAFALMNRTKRCPVRSDRSKHRCRRMI